MVNTKILKDVDYKDLSLEEQLYKLIYNYVLTRQQIYNVLYTAGSTDAVDDFVSYAYEYILSYMKRYDSDRGSFSTFVYNTLDYLYPTFINQAKYHVSYYTARLMSNSRVSDKYKKRLQEFYGNAKQIDTCSDSIMTAYLSKNGGSSGKEYENIPDVALADPNANVEEIVLNGDTNNKHILEVFDKVVDKYVNRNGSQDAERNKNIIFRLTFRDTKSDETLQSVANDYGITRERVRQIYSRFCNWAKRNNELRNVLGLGRYQPEDNYRRND